MKKVKPQFKYCYVQSWGTYANQTFVVVNMTKAEIVSAMKKRRLDAEAIDAFARIASKFGGDALVWTYDGKTLLWFRGWNNGLEDLGNLTHETNHLIYDVLVKDKGFKDEPEAMAYQQEFLFMAIAKKLEQAFRAHTRRKK